MPVKDEQGRWQNKEGGFVHPDLVPADKQLEDELVDGLIGGALALHQAMFDFKVKAFAECYGFVDLLRQRYNMERITTQSGSVRFKTYDGVATVEIQIQKLITFDQKLNLAKEKIDEYLDELTSESNAEIKTLITRAFEVNKGKVDAKKIISLKGYDIKHPKWLEAMEMINDATEIAGSKSYIRFKMREDGRVDGREVGVILDMAGIDVSDKDITLYNKPNQVE